MSTAYEHIKQYSRSPLTLECEVCQQVCPALSVRSHLKTKEHQKNAIEFTKQIILKETAGQSIYQTSRTSKLSLREKFSQRWGASVNNFILIFSRIC